MFLATSHQPSRSSRVAPEPELMVRPSTSKSTANTSSSVSLVDAPTSQQQTSAAQHNALQSSIDSAVTLSSRTVDLIATRLPQAGNTVLVVAPAPTLPTTVVIPLSLPAAGTGEVKAAPPAPLAIRLPVSLTPKETDSDAGDDSDENDNEYSDSDLKAPQVSRAALKAAPAPLRGALADEIASSAAMEAYTEAQVVEYARKNAATSKLNPNNVRFHGLMCKLRDAHKDGIACVAYSEDNNLLASAGDDGLIVIWNVARQKAVRVLNNHVGIVYSLQWANYSSTYDLLSCGRDSTVKIWSIEDGSCKTTMRDHGSNAMYCALWSNDGQMIATTGKSRHILVYNLPRAKAKGLDLNKASKSVVMVDIKPKGPQNEKGHSDIIRKIIWTHDNFHIVSASDDSSIKSWNVARGGSFVREFAGHTKKVHDICLDAKGARLLSCSADGNIKIWKYATTDCIRTITGGHFGAVLAAQWTPELGGRRIVSAGEDKAICVWEASTGLLMQKLENVHTGPIRCISMRPDGLAFATASTEPAVGIWRAIPPSMCESCGWAMYSCGKSALTFAQEVWTAKLPEDELESTGKSKDTSSRASTVPTLTSATGTSAQAATGDSSSDVIGVNGSVFIPPSK